MGKNLILVEKCFTVLALVIFTQGLVQLIYEMRTGRYSGFSSEGNLDVMVAFFIIYVITFLLVLLRWKKVIPALNKRKLLILLALIALISVFWSVTPQVTIRRSGALLGTTMFGIYFGTRYSLNEQFRLLLWTYGIAMFLSIVFAVLLPPFGIHQSGDWAGRWRGIYTHKNTLGRNMGFSLLLFTLQAIWGGKSRQIGWIGCGFATALLLLSGSVTPVLSTLTVFTLLPLYNILRWRYKLTTLLFTAAAILYVILSVIVPSVVATLIVALGRNLTFSGRTPLWSAVIEAIQKRPWLGYGYSAFWEDENNEALQVWRVLDGWRPDYAHNGYLELALQLGLLGVVVFAIDFFFNFFLTLTLAAANKSASSMFSLAFMTYMIPYNITDSIILSQNNIIWVVYISMTLSIAIAPVKLIIHSD